MSYCVHCGVELAQGEKVCPLCNTKVYDPNGPDSNEKIKSSFPKKIENPELQIERKYGTLLMTLLLSIPVLLSIICDLLSSQHLSWSLYVCTGIAYFWILAILPHYFEKSNPYLITILDTVATVILLMFVAMISGNVNWFLPLALPLSLLGGLIAMAIIFQCNIKKKSKVYIIGNMMFIMGVGIVLVEVIIRHYLQDSFKLNWSLYAAVSFAVQGIIFHIVDKSTALKERIRKKLFL